MGCLETYSHAPTLDTDFIVARKQFSESAT